MTRIGSLFSGAGGLDIAVETVTGGDTVFQAEVDPHANQVLAAHWPEVPNLGDVTAVDWTGMAALSVRPEVICAGFPCQDVSTAGLRAGLAGKRSGLWSEVVRALDVLRPKAVVIENVRGLLSHTDETGTKAVDIVLGALVTLGYSARWTVLPASAVGAPHRRARVFILGFAADDPTVERIEAPKVGTMAVLPTPRSNDSTGAGIRGEGGITLRQAATLYGTPEWGKYEPAVQRWEALTRRAPYPVEPNKNGRARLVAAFSEWMMGWPRGWVTDVVTTRTHALKIIGNGVVPHQAAAALRLLGLREVLGLETAA